MGQRIQIDLYDDLDGSITAEETISYGLDGKTYEIDLSTKNATALRKALDKYVTASRVTSKGSVAKAKAVSNAPQQACPSCGGSYKAGAGMSRHLARHAREESMTPAQIEKLTMLTRSA